MPIAYVSSFARSACAPKAPSVTPNASRTAPTADQFISGTFQAVLQFLLGDSAFFDDTPVGLGHVDSAGALAAACARVEHEVDRAIHGCKHLDTRPAGGLTRQVGAGCNHRLSELFDQRLSDRRTALPQTQASAI